MSILVIVIRQIIVDDKDFNELMSDARRQQCGNSILLCEYRSLMYLF